DEGIKIRTLSHYKNSNSVEWETFYKENGFKEKANRYSNGTNKLIDEIVYQEQNKVDVRTYFSEDSKTLRKIRYFKDGDHLRWDINYENGLKKAVKLYNVSNYEFVKEYIYTSDDFELSESLKNDYHDMVGENMLKNIIDDNVLGDYLSKELNLGVNDLVYVEDFKLINDISINGNHECAEEYCTEEAEIIYSINGIKYLNELNSLTITNEEISEITNDLKYLVKLKKLNLNNNSITKLTGLNELRGELDEINLSDNNIEELSLNNDNLKIGILNLENSQLVKIDHNIFDLKNNNKIDKIKLTTNSNLPIEFDKQDYQQLSDGNLFITNNKPLLNLVNKNNVDIYTEDEYDDLDNMIITNQFKDLIKLNGDAIINEITLGFLDNDKEFQLETIVDDKKRDEILNKYHLNKTFLDINKEHIISKEDFKHEGTYFLTISYRKNGLSLTSNVYVRVFKTSEKQYIDNISNGLPGTDRDRYVTFDENNEVQEISDEEYEDIKNNDESIIHSEDINNDIIDENNKAGLILNSIMKTVLNSANDIVNSSMDNVINKNLDEGIIESDYQVQKDEEYLENFDTFYGVKTMMKYITPAQNKKRDYGKYPAGNPGAILATNANRIGHAAILTGTSFDTIEANVPGVQNLKGKYNKWIGNRRYVNQGPGKYQNGDVFAVKVNGLNRDKNKKVVDWARKQLKKRYNFNYLNADQDNTFYCSQLVYRAFLKTYNINLDTSDNNVWIFDPHYVYNKKSKRYVREFYSLRKVIHPMELIATKKTNLIYLQRWGK
ncbi:MAG: hypothetical protein LBT75_04740, partial [Bacilli bacterium]|nr:hypothetical protein [Bacilli bacterium]